MAANKDDKNPLYSLISLDDFKAIMGIDDREDKIARFCLVTGTFAIEQYCKRQLLRKKHFERIEYIGDLLLPLREYPVSRVLAVYLYGNGEILEPDFYSVFPECDSDYDLPFSLSLSRAIQRYSGISSLVDLSDIEGPKECLYLPQLPFSVLRLIPPAQLAHVKHYIGAYTVALDRLFDILPKIPNIGDTEPNPGPKTYLHYLTLTHDYLISGYDGDNTMYGKVQSKVFPWENHYNKLYLSDLMKNPLLKLELPSYYK